MKKELRFGIFFFFLFALFVACSSDPRNTGHTTPSEPTGWNKSNDLSKGVFYALAAHPTNPNIIYAASSTLSVYKTTDGGATWTAANRGLPGQPVRSLLVDPINPLKIFAAVAGGELYKTIDAADSWQVIGSGLAQQTSYAVALNPYAPPTGIDIIAGDKSNSLSWNAVPNATAYRVYYRDCSSCTSFPPSFDNTWVRVDIADPTILQFIHNTLSNNAPLSNGTPYYYVVKAMFGSEETAASAMVSSVPAVRNTIPTPPPPPDGIKVTAGDDENTVRWGVVSGAATYNVYRQATPNVALTNPNRIATGLTSTTYTDIATNTAPLNGTPAYYVVTAVVNTVVNNVATAVETAKSTEVSATAMRMTSLYVGTGGGGVFSSGPAGEFRKSSNGGLGTGDGLDVSALLIDPTVAHTSLPTLYAGTRAGVYRSVDGGDNWNIPNSAGLTDTSILSLALAPGGILYAGTPSGIFKGVADGSAPWTSVGIPSMGSVTSIAVDPADSHTIYATSATGGIFKSADDGASWSAINQGLTTTDIRSILVHPQNRNLLYAGGVGVIFKSTDGGGQWTPIDLGSLENVSNPLPTASIRSIVSGSNGILYSGGSAGVFKSVNQGKNWTAMNIRIPALREIQVLAVDPDQPGILYAAPSGEGIYKSLDGGGSWREENGPPEQNGQPARQIPKFVTSLIVDPGQTSRLYAGTSGGGVFRGTVGVDGHLSWDPINRDAAAKLPTGGVHSLAILPGSAPTLYAGMFQNGTFKLVDDGSDTWVRLSNDLSDRSIDALAIHPQLPSILFAGITTGLYKSGNSGANWNAISDLQGNRIHVITFNPAVAPLGSGMYVGTDSGIFKSSDQGDHWDPLDDGMASPVYTILVDPQQSNIVYAGTVATGIYRRTQ